MPLGDRLKRNGLCELWHQRRYIIIAKEQLEILKAEFPPVLARVKKAGEDLQKLDKELDAIKAPWTPGRVPVL